MFHNHIAQLAILLFYIELLNKILKGEDISEEMKAGYIVPIHKDKDKKQYKDYRGITNNTNRS